jgi:DNA-binding response OmpR family regulator
VEQGLLVAEATPRILVADDDQDLRQLVQDILEEEQMSVLCAANGSAALELFQAAEPDVVVLDVVMPGMTGVEVCQQIRERSNVPIILLTALRQESDVVRGLEAGADDYVVKPFGTQELAARVRSALRRMERLGSASAVVDERLVFDNGALVLDTARRQIELGGRVVPLSRTEFSLLKLLADNAGRVMARDEILQHLWGKTGVPEQSRLRTYMGLLRRKLGERGRRGRYLYSHHGVGYRFEPGGER